MKIPLDKIIVPEGRQRKDFSHVERLADSFKENGQITPILVTASLETIPSWVLVAGECRTRAARLIGWTEIEAYDRDNLSPLQQKELEWEENNPLVRKNLTWQEACLAVYDLHLLKQMTHGFGTEGGRDPDAWTQKKMSAFTGYSTGRVSDTLRVAGALRREPRDDGIWNCTSWKDAAGLLIARNAKEVEDEMNRRRVLANPPQVVDAVISVLEEGAAPPTASPSESVIERRKIYISGFRVPFHEADLGDNTAYCIVGSAPLLDNKPLHRILRPRGAAVLWGSVRERGPLVQMPFFIHWNKVTTTQGIWPYSENFEYASVHIKDPDRTERMGNTATVACIPDEGSSDLPLAVIDFSIAPFAPDGMAVHCLGRVDPVAILDLGRVPIWFEPDEARYQDTVRRMTEWYESHVPGVEIVVSPR